MKQPLISILVPIYNVEKYLRQCLDSLVNQTLDNLEIICINDGSKDGSPRIIKEYANKDHRIQVINKQNTGYGDSMNRGLKKAKGKYIGIVEPDDFVELDAFANLTALAEKFQADVVKANYYYHSEKGDELQKIIAPDEVGQLIDPAKNQHIFHQPPTIWVAIYRREFLVEQGINFLPTPGASYQDTGFNFKVLASTHRAVYTDRPYLHYRIDNENSSVKSASKIFAVSEEFASIEQFLRDKDVYRQFAPIMQAAKFGSYHWNLLRLPDDAIKEFLPTMRQEFLQAKKDGTLQRSSFPRKHWLALQLLLKSPQLFLAAFKIYR